MSVFGGIAQIYYKKVPEISTGAFSKLHVYCPHEYNAPTQNLVQLDPLLLK